MWKELFLTWSDWHTSTSTMSAAKFWELMEKLRTENVKIIKLETVWHPDFWTDIIEF